MQTKFTPGPWILNGDTEIYSKNLSRGNIAKVRCLTFGPAECSLPERTANAKLIATSPDLAALALHIHAMHDDAYLTGHPEWVAIVEEAWACLEKAGIAVTN
jgi:hypothetical protein